MFTFVVIIESNADRMQDPLLGYCLERASSSLTSSEQQAHEVLGKSSEFLTNVSGPRWAQVL